MQRGKNLNTKQICYLSALIAIWGITKIYVPVKVPFFPIEYYLLALLFPLIPQKIRMLITGVIQTVDVYRFTVLWKSFEVLVVEAMNFASNLPVEPTSDEITLMGYFWLLAKIQDPVFYYGLMIGLFGLAIISVLLEMAYFATLLTAPYSIYLIFNKIGIYDFISRQTGGRFTLGGNNYE